ncbi:MAG: type I polyketide synthase, partial [Acidimicrobiales bacterium]
MVATSEMGNGDGVRRRNPIAIVGIGCRFPGATTPAEFWALLVQGGDAITEVPPDRFDVGGLYHPDAARAGAIYSRWGGFVSGIDTFDAAFFGISPREARRMDPQHRLLLEVVWEALEDGGQLPDDLARSPTGVFVGISGHDYADLQTRPGARELIDQYVNSGNAASLAANRVSYVLDLRGPSLAVDTACSSALTAVHLACASLERGECDLAVAAAVNALLTPEPTIGFCKAGMLSRTGRCRPFDAAADGYVRSEGAAAAVLKPLDRAIEDDDPVYAVILGTAVNQDGRTPGLAVPNSAAQQEVLAAVLRQAGLGPSDVQYVEAHGTGTPVGDPKEADAIGAVMATRPQDDPCLIGSAKGNVGHLEAAAGMVGLIKAALALQRRHVPPTIHCEQPSPAIPFERLRLRVVTSLQAWPECPPGRAVAGVNSFGFGGANSHVLLGEAPPPTAPAAAVEAPAEILVLSARSPSALRDLASRWASVLSTDDGPGLADLCATAATRRSHHEHRLAAVADSAEALAAELQSYSDAGSTPRITVGRAAHPDPPAVAFVFSGMGAQRWGTGRELLDNEPVFAAAVDECDRLLLPLAGWTARDELEAAERESRLDEPQVAHVVNFTLQVALASLWRSWGITPDAVVGHSSGELAAAHVAGALDLADAIRLAFHRGRLQQRLAGTGGMLAAAVRVADAPGVMKGLEDRVSVAAINGPASLTFSGDRDALAEIAGTLEHRGCFHRLLPVSVPYHGPRLDDLRDEFLSSIVDIEPRPPTIPLASTVGGEWQNGLPLDAGHWWASMREPVRFADAVGRVIDAGHSLFVEVGPHPVLA